MLFLSRSALLAIFGVISAAAWKDHCEKFTASIPNVVLEATYYAPGALVNLTSPSSAVLTTKLPAFCRLALTITTNTTSGNQALTEVWMPDDWNARLLGFGNGGLSGGVVYSALADDGISQGYSSFSTNTGHQSDIGHAGWAWNDTNAQEDFGYRAFQLSYQAAKSLTEEYYGKSILKKYYLGCSTAGRMGLVEAQRFPEDFDGIVVGSPANPVARLASWNIHMGRQVLPVNGSRWIPEELWPVIHAEVLKQCDGLDGVMDGVLDDPRQCLFRPEAIACGPSSNSSTCLTLDQIAALRGLYTDWYSQNGTFLFSGWDVGGELAYGGPYSYASGPDIPIGPEYYKYFIFGNPDWEYNTLTESDIFRAIETNPGQVDNNGYNYTSYFTRGGKLLHYVGLADQVISAGNSYVTYNSISAFTTAYTNLDVNDHYRFYPVPGMYHCNGGVGANAFGGDGQRTSGMPPLIRDSKHDILTAMVDWVENGNAPTDLIAAKYTNNNSTQGIEFTRKLCPYPQKGVYQGGDQNSSNSFVCQ
ncbi:hypothetical protein NliqN6_1606 [Naganishia liquefaciens]|uniref:Carboxylic ester hydrolase n=1 Tax=Naganishia liquefaciens TaxID=104408 RepID=A0A8H3TS23_9TREE|nr:hypothetical protein NliqN6_1606 [Naganishia liquefaciens]